MLQGADDDDEDSDSAEEAAAAEGGGAEAEDGMDLGDQRLAIKGVSYEALHALSGLNELLHGSGVGKATRQPAAAQQLAEESSYTPRSVELCGLLPQLKASAAQ